MPVTRIPAALLLLAVACACAPADNGGAETPSATAHDGPHFEDVAARAGLVEEFPAPRAMDTILESTGSGVAVADYDGDGFDDLYFPHQPTVADYLAGVPGPPNELYRNNGDGTFTEVAAEAGVALYAWSNAAYFADYDNDGDQDLFVANWGRNNFFWNNGDGTFTDLTDAAGVAGDPDAWSVGAAFADFDEDGLLDLFVVNYAKFDPADPPHSGIRPVWRNLAVWVGPKGLPGQFDRAYRNLGNGTFVDRSADAGLLDQPALYGLSIVAQDLDLDADVDLYVANDSVVNQLWRNDMTLPFVEVGAATATATNENATEFAGLGVDAGDFNGDGLIDLFVTNVSHSFDTLYVNEGGMRFREGTFEAGLNSSWAAMGWGTKFFDYDHDGLLDIGIANGHVYPQIDSRPEIGSSLRQPNRLLRNTGEQRFEEVADAAWGEPGISRGLALIDYDRDGDLDVAMTHIDGPPSLLRNEGGNMRNWISVRLIGVNSNRDGTGARLQVETGGMTLTRLANPFGSFQSQSSAWIHFGLGEAQFVDRLHIEWPRGRQLEYPDLQANRFYTIREDTGITEVVEPMESIP
jgi:hypothetical protein